MSNATPRARCTLEFKPGTARQNGAGQTIAWTVRLPGGMGASATALFFAAVIIWTVLGNSIVHWVATGWWWLAAPGLLFALSALRMAAIVGQGVLRHVA